MVVIKKDSSYARFDFLLMFPMLNYQTYDLITILPKLFNV
jgi:hypothetical protein